MNRRRSGNVPAIEIQTSLASCLNTASDTDSALLSPPLFPTNVEKRGHFRDRNSIFSTETQSASSADSFSSKLNSKSSIESLRSPLLSPGFDSPTISGPFAPILSEGRAEITDRTPLGSGQTSRVYQGALHLPSADSESETTVQVVALKQLISRSGSAQLLHEYHILSRIFSSSNSPPNSILGFYGLYKVRESYAMAIELCQGSLLSQKATEFNLDFWRRWTRQSLEALVWLHEEMKIIHCDIKPQNIMLTFDCQARITDFSSARCKDIEDDESVITVGTAEFMAPEQLMGKEATHAGDLWSVGMTMWTIAAQPDRFEWDDVAASPSSRILSYRRRSSSIVDEVKRWRKGTLEGKVVSRVVCGLCALNPPTRSIDWNALNLVDV